MSLEIKEITSPAEWDAIISPWHPNTFLQSWEWGQLQQRQGENVVYLGFKEEGQWRAAALVLTVNARRGRHYFIPHGPLVSDQKYLADVIELLINRFRQQALQDKVVALRIAPLTIATEDVHHIFTTNGFKPAPLHVHSELTWVTDLTALETDLWHNMRKTTRHAIKKGSDKVTVNFLSDEDALNRFWPLYQQTQHRHGFVPFSRKFLQQQYDFFRANGRAFAAFATVEGHDQVGALFMRYGDTVFYHHGASGKSTSGVPAAQVLHWEAMRYAKASGARRYNWWGIAPADKPKHPFRGITVFKKGFGGQELNYVRTQDLAFSWRYQVLKLVDLYRKWRRGF